MTSPGVAPSSGLAPARSVLANGVVVLAKETQTTPAVTVHLTVGLGAVCDPPGQAGTTFLLSRVIDRGTANRSASAIADELDARGISLAIAVTRHQMSFTCTCLADDFDPVLDVLGDIVMAPSFPETEIVTRKGEVLTALRQDEDNPAVRAVEALMAHLYAGHPYGWRVKGSADVVEALTRDDLVRLHRAHVSPAGLTAIVVGDVPAARASDAVARVFEGWRPSAIPAHPVPSVAPTTSRQRIVLPMPNKAQADIAYGFVGITRHDPAYYAALLMNNAFGQYSIGGRLGDNIRERQGMAYYVFSALDANLVEGPLMVRAGVAASNVDRAIAAIDDEIGRLVRDGVTDKELQESRQYLVGSMPRALETNAGIAAFLQNVEFFGLGLDYDLRLPGLLGAVTLDDVHAAARRLLDPARATVVVAGPYAEA